MKGPLVTAAVVIAAILIILSFLVVAFPGSVEMLGAVAGVFAIAAVAVMILILVRTRRSV